MYDFGTEQWNGGLFGTAFWICGGSNNLYGAKKLWYFEKEGERLLNNVHENLLQIM